MLAAMCFIASFLSLLGGVFRGLLKAFLSMILFLGGLLLLINYFQLTVFLPLIVGFGDMEFLYLWVAQTAGGLAAIYFTAKNICMMRKSLVQASLTGSEWPIIKTLVLSGLAIAAAFVLFIFMPEPGENSSDPRILYAMTVGFAITAGAGSIITITLIVGTALLMLIHRAVWPFISRVLYVVPRNGFGASKKFLATLGFALAGIAFTGQYGWNLVVKLVGGS
ncbi:hypothetical protein IQ289_25905 [Burkholderia sp. R-70006]|uniref:hypothetical protein n=1 Tax=Paraburkholderia domus TaxID=2793075 RepID=UPI001912AA4E|nr:hypothetical protein [Paraburkholderia domus]MBK5051821.1 hypothetical protein [Burkholderia sp. R-70006]